MNKTMNRYYIKKAKLELAVTTLINTDWDNPHIYMQNTTASDITKYKKRWDKNTWQINFSLGLAHFQKVNKRKFEKLFWFYFDLPKKEKSKLKTASLDVWRKIYIEKIEQEKKFLKEHGNKFTFGDANE